MFAQYIFSRISRRALDARKLDVSKNDYHNRTNRINWYVREDLAAPICILMLDAHKFSCEKIYMFSVKKIEKEEKSGALVCAQLPPKVMIHRLFLN